MLLDYDALIVGAGPAGCAAAFDLARAGRRVLLLDKRSFPRHKACACGLTRKTLKALRYPVEPVLERLCREVVLQEAGPAFLRGRRTAAKDCEIRVRLRSPFCAMAVRSRFDAFCLAQTLAQGATLLKIETITALRELPTHIELTATLPGGEECIFRAPSLVGADGSNGQIRRLAAGLLRNNNEHPDAGTREGANGALSYVAAVATAAQLPPEPTWYARGFALEATVPYAALPHQLPAHDAPHDLVFDFSPIAGGYGWLFPKGDHINLGVGGFVPQLSPGSADTPARNTPASGEPVMGQPATGEPATLYEVVTRPLLAAYMREKLGISLTAESSIHVSGQHLGLGGHAYVPAGRVLLTGDAAGLVDPLTGEGIHSALVSGQAAAVAILETLPALTGDPATDATHAAQGRQLAAAYAHHLRPLQETLAFSHRAARSFYREPARGFKVMRNPLLRGLVLKTYADGLPTAKLLSSLARQVA